MDRGSFPPSAPLSFIPRVSVPSSRHLLAYCTKSSAARCWTGAETGAETGAFMRALSTDTQASNRTKDKARLGHVPVLLWDGDNPLSSYRTVGNLRGRCMGHSIKTCLHFSTEFPGGPGPGQRCRSSWCTLMTMRKCHQQFGCSGGDKGAERVLSGTSACHSLRVSSS